MCGIASIISRKSRVNPERLQAGMKALHHRGPDGQNHIMVRGGTVGLGHTRLSINDLSFGTQPISNETNDVHIIVNGEFYDFRQLKIDLEKMGHKFKTSSDSEVLLHLYEEYGIHALSKLSGEFAFVLVDEVNDLIYVGRDRFGVKPLFYAEVNGDILIASEIKALFAMGLKPQWDDRALANLVRTFVPASDETLFANVNSVKPAHYLVIAGSRVREIEYWDPNLPKFGQELKLADEAEYVARFKDALSTSIKWRLDADVPVGCYLSGGIDSSAVLGLAHSLGHTGVQVFSLSFADSFGYDEIKIAKKMADHTGAHFNQLDVSQKDLADNFADTIYFSETLCLNAHSVGKFLLSRFVNKHKFKVVLTGEGSDEILGGYGFFKTDIEKYGAEQPQTAIPGRFDRSASGDGSNAISIAHADRVLGFKSNYLQSRATVADKCSAFLSDDFLKVAQKRDYFQSWMSNLAVGQKLNGRSAANQSMYMFQKSMLVCNMLTFLGDRVEMAHAVEGRVPFLDHHVVELAAQLPLSMKLRNGKEKFILHESVKDLVPADVYGRKKHPFLSAPATTNPESPLFALMQDTFNGNLLNDIPLFNKKKILTFMDTLPKLSVAEKLAVDLPLMAVLSACFLQEKLKPAAPYVEN